MTNWRTVEKQEARGSMVFLKLEKLGVLEKGFLFIASVIITLMIFIINFNYFQDFQKPV